MESWSGKDITPEIWERVRTLFEGAFEKEADQRAAYLAQNCPEESIRERVEEILANHDKAGDFLADPAVADLTAPAVWSFEPTLSPGTLLAGRFKVVRFIAEGGMGEVYEAEDLELHEHLAIKTLRPETLQEATAIARFKREVHLARKVTHPNVCRIYDLFRDRPDGNEAEIVFVSMEFLRGETLASRIRNQGRMRIAEALPLITQMASALSAAHEAGIVHGDFKPGNVVLVEEPTGFRAVVTDFGLAFRAIRSAADPSLSGTSWLPVSLRKGDGLHGTPAYMAPEQLEGQPASTASDIYSFGLVIFEMVTGARPFQGDTPISTAARRLAELPPSPRKIEPSLSPASESVILRCLDRDPAKRFERAQDVAWALGEDVMQTGRYQAGEMMADLKSLKRVAASGRGRRRRTMAIVMAIVVLAGMVVSYWRYTQRRSSHIASPLVASNPPVKLRPAVAVLGFKNLSGRPDAAWLSTALSETLTTELAAGEKLRTIPGENVARAKTDLSLPDAESYAQDTLGRIRKNLDTDFVVVGSYLDLGKKSGGQVRLDLRLQDARAGVTIAAVSETGTEAHLLDLILRTGTELRGKLGVGGMTATDDSAVRASVPSDPEATRLYAEGLKRLRVFDFLGARDLLRKAIAAEPNYPMAHSALAVVWSNLGYDPKEKEEAKKAFDLSGNLLREDRLSVEARYRQMMKDWNKAIELYRTLFNFFPDNLDYGLALANAQRQAGKVKDALATVEALRKLPTPTRDDPRIDLAEARTAFSLGDFKREQEVAARAAEKAGALGAPLLVAAAQLNQCWALQRSGQYQDALAACEKAKSTYAATGDRAGEGRALLNAGVALYHHSDLAGAQIAYEQALAAFRQVGDKDDMAKTLDDMGGVISDRGDYIGAKSRFEQALTIYREVGDKDGAGSALGNIASELMFTGDLNKANRKFREALTTERETGREDFVVADLANLGRMLYLQGNLGESHKMLDESLAICRRLDDKQDVGEVLGNLGDLLTSEENLDRAMADYQQAMKIKSDIGNEIGAAVSRISIAELLIKEGHAASAEPLIREAREVFRRQKDTDDEISADTALTRALLSQGKSTDARKEVDAAIGAAAKLQNEEVRLKVSLAAASVRGDSGKPADLVAAAKSLEATLGEAKRHGYVGYEFEARLALGEIEMKSGHTATGRGLLAALEKDARTKGFLLVAHKATAAAKG